MEDGDDIDSNIFKSTCLSVALILELSGPAEYNHKFHVMFAVRSCREQGV